MQSAKLSSKMVSTNLCQLILLPLLGNSKETPQGSEPQALHLRKYTRHQETPRTSLSSAGSSPSDHISPSLQVHGQKAAWEDPVEWVRDTLPWPSAQQDQSKLYHLPPPTVGPHSIASPPEDRTVKDSTPSSLDSDPLVSRGRSEAKVRVSQN